MSVVANVGVGHGRRDSRLLGQSIQQTTPPQRLASVEAEGEFVAAAPTSAGMNPPVNRSEIEIPTTDPMVIKTRLGGTVSDIAPEELSIATNSPSSSPRFFISGNSAGATAAMSAALEPEIPDTRYMAPSKTYDNPPRT